MKTFECPFSYYGRKNPKLIALALPEKSWSYEECNNIIENFCYALTKEGVKPGDAVAFIPTPSFPLPLLFFALFRLRAIACPINTYFPLRKLPQTLSTLTANFFLFPDETKDKIPSIEIPSLSLSSLLNIKGKGTFAPTFLNKDIPATYLFTSGTSSTPKIACHSIGNHYYSALGSNAYLPLKQGDRWLLSLPLYHIAGIALLFRTFLAGATITLPITKAHDAAEILQSKATHVSFVPTQLKRLLEMTSHENFLKLNLQLKAILLGGSTVSPALYQDGCEKGLPVYPSYGMTEMSSQICTQFLPGSPSFSLGHPLPYREISIDEKKEIYVRGKTLFLGYLKGKNSYDLPLNSEGWFATGDLGLYSSKKGLFHLGRKDRLFISGGENIYPEEIEHHLKLIEGMIDVRIEPAEDLEFGKRPVAYVQSEKPFHEGDLKEYLGIFLPKFKIPVAFYPLKKPKSKLSEVQD